MGETKERIRVGVIMGGMSSEKEVSLESGRNIFSKMDRRRYDPLPIFMDSRARLWEIPLKLLMRNSTKDIEEDLENEAVRLPYESLRERVEVVYLGLHGKYGEDGCVQGLLELLGVPYTGSGVLASAIGMDKYTTRRILTINGIDVPRTVAVREKEWAGGGREEILERIAAEISYPCVVKPIREGCSTAVKKVVSPAGLPAALEGAFVWDEMALVEEFIEGVEVTCGILGDDPPVPLVPSETIPTQDILSLEDKFLYGQGENKTPARVPPEVLKRIQETALATFSALDLKGYARIDMFVRADGRVAVLEPNTLPGMTPSTVLFHQAAALGITQTELITRVIEAAMKAHREKKGPL
ncbi:MAG TPA: D-alanine--D-alanine ligase family protein [Syntrophales bacterium]|nr:D-alanine--D-alanine ligase family protein [Syntrophales bacterium]HOM07481.1 D-alanine--D-alanine ligase family protein [Syntrophales bacterium]HOO00016.1 D-alanine--D-alanine ligase family protein [Syntrophales bacterium]HPC00870.1 D-alanine--D-alanine ligase family protein [Syntrophales bacterium]HPQ07100.1 D-alanine--D-alanine ligase family protein [Syntrophales bacterium]